MYSQSPLAITSFRRTLTLPRLTNLSELALHDHAG